MSRRLPKDQAAAQLFRVLGDPSRLRIIKALFVGETNVSQLCRKLRLTQPTVSRHLGILRMARLAIARREGKENHYSLPSEVKRLLKSLVERVDKLAQ